MDNMTYKLRLKKNEFEVEVQGDKDWVEKKFEALLAQNNKKNEFNEAQIQKADISETMGEFLGEKGNPQKHTDIITVFAYWLFKKENMTSFNVKDIVECYDKTRIPKPANPNTIINAIVSAHFLAEVPDKKENLKAWIITRTGEEYVNQLR